MKLNRISLMVAGVLMPCATFAQSDGNTEQNRNERILIEEVVVTAAKRVASLQDTAFAISAFSGDALESRGIDDLANLQSYVPGLHVGQEQDGFKVSLRGIGLQGTSSITDPGVAFYIDNLYIPRPSGGSAIFYDIDRIEVLRGPQGTLYGRNATGGVVNVISNRPTPDPELRVGFTYGSRNLREMRGVGNLPIGENAAARLAVVQTQEDGYVDNQPGLAADDPFGTDGDTTVRGQISFVAPGDVDILVSATHSDLNGTGVAYHFLERNVGGPPPTQALLATLPPDPEDPLKVANDASAYNDTETSSFFVRAERAFDGFNMFLQGGMLWQDSNIQQDFDGSPVDVAIFNKDQENDARSLEFHLSSADIASLKWILGAYYFEEDTDIFRRVRLNGLTPGGVISLPDFLLHESGASDTIAGFANITYPFTERMRISGGVRYTEDTKEGSLFNESNFGLPTTPVLADVEEKFTQVTWRGGVEFDVSDWGLLYANVSTGYKAGGFNITSNGAPYDEETVLAYELGIKSNPFDGRAQINIDAFHYSYEDMQLTTLTTINNAPGQFTTNAGESTIYGIEFDTQFAVTNSLLATVTYAYINAEFDEYFNTDPRDPSPVFNPTDPEGLGREDLGGNKVPYVSEHAITAGLRYSWDLGNGRLEAAVNTSWHSEMFLREYNNPAIDRVGSNAKTDLTLGYLFHDIGLSVTGFVTNLEDDVEKTNIYISPGFIGASATTAYSKPRTVGLKVDFEF